MPRPEPTDQPDSSVSAAESDDSVAAERTFTGIGTTWTIGSRLPIPSDTFDRILGEVEAFDATYSRFRSDSAVSALARTGGSFEFPSADAELFDLYDQLYTLTDGAVSPLVGGALDHLGYDADYTLQRKPGSVVVPSWRETVGRSGAARTTLTMTEPAVIDIGAAGKGFLADRIARLLEESGATEITVDASGDLVHRGEAPVRVALEHPFDPSKAIGLVELGNGALCASGSNRRVWGSGLHHIVDGRTALPTTDVIATWVLAPTALLADGLATALFFAQPSALGTRYSFEWVRMFSSGTAERSRSLPGELFSR